MNQLSMSVPEDDEDYWLQISSIDESEARFKPLLIYLSRSENISPLPKIG